MNICARCVILLTLALMLLACQGPAITPTIAPTPEANLTSVRADVLLRAGATGALVPPGETRPLAVGQAIDVNETGRARLRFHNYLIVDVFRGTELQLESMAAPDAPPAYKFKLEGGTLFANVDPATEVVSIESDMAVITALGTKFWMHVRPGKITWAMCKEGKIQITAQGKTVTVPEGYHSWVLPGEPPHEAVPAYRRDVIAVLPSVEDITGGEKTDEDVFLPEEEVTVRRAATDTPTPTGAPPPTNTPTPTRTRRPTNTPTPTSSPPIPLPDLMVMDVGLTEDNRIYCVFENVGEAEVPQGEVWIAVYVNRARISYSMIETPIPVGGVGEVVTGAVEVSGEVLVACLVDAEDDIAEIDEGNNVARRRLEITPPLEVRPDLVVTDISLMEGNEIRCSYQNVGEVEVPEGDVWLDIFVNGERVRHSTVWTPIPAGQGGWFQMAPLDISGSVSVVCVIDAENGVVEANEGNNKLERYLEMEALGCELPPHETFAEIQQELELGCAQDEAHLLVAAWQPFNMGYMIWREDTRQIYVLVETAYVTPIIPPGSWEAYADEWVDGMPEFSCVEAQYQNFPIRRGFGYLWCNESGVRDALGSSRGEEMGDQRFMQSFERGWAMHIGEWEDGIVVLTDDAKWRHYPR